MQLTGGRLDGALRAPSSMRRLQLTAAGATMSRRS